MSFRVINNAVQRQGGSWSPEVAATAQAHRVAQKRLFQERKAYQEACKQDADLVSPRSLKLAASERRASYAAYHAALTRDIRAKTKTYDPNLGDVMADLGTRAGLLLRGVAGQAACMAAATLGGMLSPVILMVAGRAGLKRVAHVAFVKLEGGSLTDLRRSISSARQGLIYKSGHEYRVGHSEDFLAVCYPQRWARKSGQGPTRQSLQRPAVREMRPLFAAPGGAEWL